jgi:hypothetical protein
LQGASEKEIVAVHHRLSAEELVCSKKSSLFPKGRFDGGVFSSRGVTADRWGEERRCLRRRGALARDDVRGCKILCHRAREDLSLAACATTKLRARRRQEVKACERGAAPHRPAALSSMTCVLRVCRRYFQLSWKDGCDPLLLLANSRASSSPMCASEGNPARGGRLPAATRALFRATPCSASSCLRR